MAYQPKISDLRGANMFWNRYGWTIEEHGRSQYKATGKSEIIADTLSQLWFALGDRAIANRIA